jgi:hypothetical protein
MNGPMSLGDLFGGHDNDDADGENGNSDTTPSNRDNEFKQNYELQNITILDKTIKIRQFSWHQTNANQVWPGTFRLAEYIINNSNKYSPDYDESNQSSTFKILELGAATGALSIYLKLSSTRFDMITSDIDDGGEVFENLCFNYKLNGKLVIYVYV